MATTKFILRIGVTFDHAICVASWCAVTARRMESSPSPARLPLHDLHWRDMLNSVGGTVRITKVAFGLTGRGDILGACLLENPLAFARPFLVVRVHRQQNPALPYPTLVPLRVVLRNPQSDERAGHAADGSASAHAREGRHDGPRCDE